MLVGNNQRMGRIKEATWQLMIPYVVVFVIFLALPVIWSFYLSLQKGGLMSGMHFVGLSNYVNVWKDAIFVKTIKNTAYYVIIIVPTVMIFSLILAVLINKMKRFQNFVKVCIFLPLISSVVPLCLAWVPLLVPGENGALNFFLKTLFHIPPQNWLGTAKLAIPTIAIFEFWRGFGNWTIIFLGGLAAISEDYYEAARIDGANEAQMFWFITIPLLRPTFVFLTVMGFIWNFQIFDAIYMLTRGGPGYESYTMVWYVYRNAFLYDNIGFAATMGVILLAIIGILGYLAIRILERD
jgi:multiple sugar transport system permease protein